MGCLQNDGDAKILQYSIRFNDEPKERELARFLNDNYDALLGEKNQEEMLSQLEREICEGDKMKSKDVAYIKNATKVMHNSIVEGRKASDGLLKKLYKLNRKGIKNIERMPESERKIPRFRNMHSHFYSHAGNTAQEVFYRTGDKRWAKLWFLNNARSAELVENFDEKHAGHSYGFAAKVLYHRTKKIEWAEQWHNGYVNSAVYAERSKEFDHAKKAYFFAAEAANELYSKTKDQAWKLESKKCTERLTHLK